MNKNLLSFGKGNAKLDGFIQTFSLPSGYTCPGAEACLSKADKVTGKITDGAACQFRCFSASQECTYPNVRIARWRNFELIRNSRTIEGMRGLIHQSIPPKTKAVRIHVAGDFFNQNYFDAWIEVAKLNPTVIFYAYTKSLPFWIARMGQIPSNLILTASFGGKHDALIEKHNLRYAKVVYSVEEAEKLGLEIDHDDSHAYTNGPSFALLLHGVQPANTEASKALSSLRKLGIGGYGSQSKKRAQATSGGGTPPVIGAKSVSVK